MIKISADIKISFDAKDDSEYSEIREKVKRAIEDCLKDDCITEISDRIMYAYFVDEIDIDVERYEDWRSSQ